MKLYALSALLENTSPGRNKLLLTYEKHASEEEAIGHFVKNMQETYPLSPILQLVVLEIPKESYV